MSFLLSVHFHSLALALWVTEPVLYQLTVTEKCLLTLTEQSNATLKTLG
jgi:hypothetical protein